MLGKLFSVSNCGSRKIINIMGIKIKLLDLKPEVSRLAVLQNKNMLSMLRINLHKAEVDDLFCLKSNNLLFILQKGVLDLDYKFFQDYILPSGFEGNNFELIELDKNSLLYKEHVSRIQQGEFLWKYVERYYFIAHSFISKDEEGNIYINSSYVQEANQVQSEFKIQHVPMVSKRKYINGITVAQYLEGKSKNDKFVVIDKLLNYMFSTYRDENDTEKVSGNLFDCHLGNFLIGDDGQFHFFDFDLKCTEALDKGYCIYFMLSKYDQELYKMMLKTYGLEDNSGYYAKNYSIYKQPSVQNGKSIITEEHVRLQKKYFGDLGLIPQYELKYEKVNLALDKK